MKNNNKKNTKVINQYNIFPVTLQFIFTILTVILCILTVFKYSFTHYFELFLGLDLLVMAYNNHILFFRKNFTIIYLIFGLIMILISILGFMGVVF